jgi:hypothetical protein
MHSLRLTGLVVGIVALGGCCTTLSRNGEVVRSPAVTIRGVFAGWLIGGPITTRPREFETWEVRIALDGRTQETRGWRAAEGFLPVVEISPAEARRFYELARRLSVLPEYVGGLVTDTPFRQIDFMGEGLIRTVSAYPATAGDKDAELFDEIWYEIARRFPERTVCR